jgi:cytochrome c553
MKKIFASIVLAGLGLTVVSANETGAELYQKCQGCHGINGEKHPFGQPSNPKIGGFDALRVKLALKGYGDGTYGNNMKDLMKLQVKNLTEDQINLLAEYVATLKY